MSSTAPRPSHWAERKQLWISAFVAYRLLCLEIFRDLTRAIQQGRVSGWGKRAAAKWGKGLARVLSRLDAGTEELRAHPDLTQPEVALDDPRFREPPEEPLPATPRIHIPLPGTAGGGRPIQPDSLDWIEKDWVNADVHDHAAAKLTMQEEANDLENRVRSLPHSTRPKRPPRRRRQQKLEPKPLTPKQIEAVQLFGECKGDVAEVGRRLGIDRKSAQERLEAAQKKMGERLLKAKAKTHRMPTDLRGQEAIADQDEGPASLRPTRTVIRDRRG